MAKTEKYEANIDNVTYSSNEYDDETLFKLQRQFAYTKEEMNKYIVD